MAESVALPPQVCSRLKALMRTLGLSQAKVAHGLSQGNVSNILSGKPVRQASIATLLQNLVMVDEAATSEVVAEIRLHISQDIEGPWQRPPLHPTRSILALRELADSKQPFLVALQGPPRSGKTTGLELLLAHAETAKAQAYLVSFLGPGTWYHVIQETLGQKDRSKTATAFTQWLRAWSASRIVPTVLCIDGLYYIAREEVIEMLRSLAAASPAMRSTSIAIAVPQQMELEIPSAYQVIAAEPPDNP